MAGKNGGVLGRLDQVVDDFSRRTRFFREPITRGEVTCSVRIWRGVYHRNFVSPTIAEGPGEYATKCAATIVSIRGSDHKPLDPIQVRAILQPGATTPEALWSSFDDGRKFIRARVQNKGSVPLFGSETGRVWP